MYLIVLDQGEHSGIKNGLEIAFLLVLWADVIFEIYHKTFEVLRISSKFQTRFYIRIILLTLLTMDQIIFLLADTSNPIRPFVVLRACTYLLMKASQYATIQSREKPSSLSSPPTRTYSSMFSSTLLLFWALPWSAVKSS